MGAIFGYIMFGLILFGIVLTAFTLVDGYVLEHLGLALGRIWDNGVTGIQRAV